jgi:hypothetical protein
MKILNAQAEEEYNLGNSMWKQEESRTHLEGRFVANLNAGVATHEVVREDSAGVVDPCESLGHPEVGTVGSHLAHATRNAILPLRAFY